MAAWAAAGAGRWPSTQNTSGTMVELAGKEKTRLGKASNEHGFEKRKTRRSRGRRGLPSSGGGCRREWTRWPEKLAEEFAGNLAVPNFGVRSAGLRVAAQKNGLYFWNPRVEGYADIYIYAGFVDFGKSRYFSNYCFSELK